MKIFGYTPAQLKKSIIAFVTPGAVALGVALTTESPGGATVTGAEWLGIAVAMLGTSLLVFKVQNAPADPLPDVKQEVV
jgi:hypothetical protein